MASRGGSICRTLRSSCFYPVSRLSLFHLIVLTENKKNGFFFFSVQSIRTVADCFTNGNLCGAPPFSSSPQDHLWPYFMLPSLELLQCSIKVVFLDFRAALSKHMPGYSSSVPFPPPLRLLLLSFQNLFETSCCLRDLFPCPHPMMSPFLSSWLLRIIS